MRGAGVLVTAGPSRAMLQGMDHGDPGYARAWRLRFERAEEERGASAVRARALLPELIGHLVEKYGVCRVWLFGSLAEDAFEEDSDIDLAVEGMPPGAALFRAGAELDDIARPFRIDLVPIEEAHEAIRRRVLERGELLYDGPTS